MSMNPSRKWVRGRVALMAVTVPSSFSNAFSLLTMPMILPISHLPTNHTTSARMIFDPADMQMSTAAFPNSCIKSTS